MIVTYFKQNNNKSSSFNAMNYLIVKTVIGKQMKNTNYVQVAFYNGFQGSMIAKGYITVNMFFNLAHNNKFKLVFDKQHFKNLL